MYLFKIKQVRKVHHSAIVNIDIGKNSQEDILFEGARFSIFFISIIITMNNTISNTSNYNIVGVSIG